MKQIFLFALLTTIGISDLSAQEAKEFYDQGMEKAKTGKLEEAIKLWDKSIELNRTEWVVWFNRGMAKAMLGYYEGAIADYEQTLVLFPAHKNAFLSRGTAKKYLTDYQGAINDYNLALQIDSNYSDAYYNRALIYELFDNKDSACADFKKAKEKGDKYSDSKIEKCKDNSPHPENYYCILRLSKNADNKKYGFSEKDPIKVGIGPNGGPANQRAFLVLLRDLHGNPIKFKRGGSCCPYSSPTGMMGMAMLDTYEIIYRNEKNEEVKAILYLSFYDYEELKIPYGFKTVGQK